MAEATEFSLHGTSSTAQPPIKVNGWNFPMASVWNCEPYIGVVYAPRGFPILQKLKRLCLKLSMENFRLQVVTNRVFTYFLFLRERRNDYEILTLSWCAWFQASAVRQLITALFCVVTQQVVLHTNTKSAVLLSLCGLSLYVSVFVGSSFETLHRISPNVTCRRPF